MRNPEDFDQNVKIEIVRLYLTSNDWSHRRLQKDILRLEAPPRGGGFVAMEILRSFGLVDDSLKGIFEKVADVNELNKFLLSSLIPDSAKALIRDLYIDSLNDSYPSQRSFLLTWNPEKWAWDKFRTNLEEFQNKGTLVLRWGCGNRKDIQRGDRLFFIKVGKEFPRGIIGSGYAVRQSYEAEHWSEEKGKIGWNVDIEFDVLLDFENELDSILDYDILLTDDILKKQAWSVQSSGTIIETSVFSRLQEIWRNRFLLQMKKYFSDKSSNRKEGKAVNVVSKKYERDRVSRDECIKIHKPVCLACGMDFEKKYGMIGKGFIHVHHVIPISQRGEEYTPNPAKDLIPLCPNCHAMIHKLGPPYSLEKLKEILLETSVMER